MKYVALVCLLVFIAFTPRAFAAAMEPDMPQSLTALTQENDWLNTARPIKPEDLKGRILLVDFWTFCCINCIHVIPELQKIEQKFGDKLTVIGVHSAKFQNEKDSGNIRNAILRYSIEHPVVNDRDFRIWNSFGTRAWPTLLLINPQGHIVETYSGEGHREAIEKDIAKLIDANKGNLVTSALPLALEKDKTPEMTLKFPGKLIFAEEANLFFVSDSGHHRVIGMAPDGKIKLVIGNGHEGWKDGDFNNAMFRTPQGLLYRDNHLYVADTENHLLRDIDLQRQQVTTLAGTGKQGFERAPLNSPALSTALASPWDLAFYPDADHIAIAMAGTHQIWSYDRRKQNLNLLAGNGSEDIIDGSAPLNSLAQTSGLSTVGDRLYFVDSETSSLRELAGGNVTTLIGHGLFDFGYSEGPRNSALMQHPLGLTADQHGVYVADAYNHAIRFYDPATQNLTNYAGTGKPGQVDGPLSMAEFNEPNGLVRVGDKLYVADTNNHQIRIIDMTTKTVSSLDVTEPAMTQYNLATDLPNLHTVKLPALTAGQSLKLELTLPQGWKINHDAPSWLAIFDSAGKPIAGFDVAQLREHHLALPALASGSYRLQATFYYCQTQEGSECLLQSIDTSFTVSATAKDSTLSIPITLAKQ